MGVLFRYGFRRVRALLYLLRRADFAVRTDEFLRLGGHAEKDLYRF